MAELLPIPPENASGEEYRIAHARLSAFLDIDTDNLKTLADMAQACPTLGGDLVTIIQSKGMMLYSFSDSKTVPHRTIFTVFSDKSIITADEKVGYVSAGVFDGPDKLGMQHSYPGFSLHVPVGASYDKVADPNHFDANEVRPIGDQARLFKEYLEGNPLHADDSDFLKLGFANRYNPVFSPHDPEVLRNYGRLAQEFSRKLVGSLPKPIAIPSIFFE